MHVESCLVSVSECTRNRLAVELCPHPHSLRSLGWIYGGRNGGEKGRKAELGKVNKKRGAKGDGRDKRKRRKKEEKSPLTYF